MSLSFSLPSPSFSPLSLSLSPISHSFSLFFLFSLSLLSFFFSFLSRSLSVSLSSFFLAPLSFSLYSLSFFLSLSFTHLSYWISWENFCHSKENVSDIVMGWKMTFFFFFFFSSKMDKRHQCPLFHCPLFWAIITFPNQEMELDECAGWSSKYGCSGELHGFSLLIWKG